MLHLEKLFTQFSRHWLILLFLHCLIIPYGNSLIAWFTDKLHHCVFSDIFKISSSCFYFLVSSDLIDKMLYVFQAKKDKYDKHEVQTILKVYV